MEEVGARTVMTTMTHAKSLILMIGVDESQPVEVRQFGHQHHHQRRQVDDKVSGVVLGVETGQHEPVRRKAKRFRLNHNAGHAAGPKSSANPQIGGPTIPINGTSCRGPHSAYFIAAVNRNTSVRQTNIGAKEGTIRITYSTTGTTVKNLRVTVNRSP